MEASESTGVSSNLTSTVESLLTNNGHEKKISHNDSISVGDSTPSSSSDANLQASIVKTIQDDPISSTSDSLIHENEMNLNTLTSDVNFIVGTEGSGSKSEIATDSDFFTTELNIESMSTEKISEDVEDIANDLQNLLGETTSNYDAICSNSDAILKTNETPENENIEKTKISLQDKDVNLDTSVKPGMHDAKMEVETIHDKNKIETSESIEGINVMPNISELNNKTDNSLKDENLEVRICANEVLEKTEKKIESSESCLDSASKDNVGQGDFIQNQEESVESNTNCRVDENKELVSYDTFSVTESATKVEKMEMEHETILEKAVNDSNCNQNELLSIEKEDEGSQLQENVLERERLQEKTVTETSNEEIKEQVQIVSTNQSEDSNKLLTEVQSDTKVFQETKQAEESCEISPQQVNSENNALKENLPAPGITVIDQIPIETCLFSVQDIQENNPPISDEADTQSSTTVRDGSINQSVDTEDVKNEELNSIQKEETKVTETTDSENAEVCVQADHETLKNIDEAFESQITPISNVESSIDTPSSVNMESNSKATDILEPVKIMDIRDIENKSLVDEKVVLEERSTANQHVDIDNGSERNQEKLSSQDVPMAEIDNKDSSNEKESDKQDLLQHSITSPNVSQKEDPTRETEINEDCESKKQPQEILETKEECLTEQTMSSDVVQNVDLIEKVEVDENCDSKKQLDQQALETREAKIELQTISSDVIQNEDLIEKMEVDEKCESKKQPDKKALEMREENIELQTMSSNVIQNEDLIEKMEVDENCESKKQSDQKALERSEENIELQTVSIDVIQTESSIEKMEMNDNSEMEEKLQQEICETNEEDLIQETMSANVIQSEDLIEKIKVTENEEKSQQEASEVNEEDLTQQTKSPNIVQNEDSTVTVMVNENSENKEQLHQETCEINENLEQDSSSSNMIENEDLTKNMEMSESENKEEPLQDVVEMNQDDTIEPIKLSNVIQDQDLIRTVESKEESEDKEVHQDILEANKEDLIVIIELNKTSDNEEQEMPDKLNDEDAEASSETNVETISSDTFVQLEDLENIQSKDVEIRESQEIQTSTDIIPVEENLPKDKSVDETCSHAKIDGNDDQFENSNEIIASEESSKCVDQNVSLVSNIETNISEEDIEMIEEKPDKLDLKDTSNSDMEVKTSADETISQINTLSKDSISDLEIESEIKIPSQQDTTNADELEIPVKDDVQEVTSDFPKVRDEENTELDESNKQKLSENLKEEEETSPETNESVEAKDENTQLDSELNKVQESGSMETEEVESSNIESSHVENLEKTVECEIQDVEEVQMQKEDTKHDVSDILQTTALAALIEDNKLVDQDDAKDMKEVAMEQEKVDDVIVSETNKPVDQDDEKDIKEVAMEQEKVDAASETNKPLDQDDEKDMKEVAMEQEKIDAASETNKPIDQDDEKDMKEVTMEQETDDAASETNKPLDQDDEKDMKEVAMEQEKVDVASETNKPVDQDDEKDMKEVVMEQEKVDVASETNKPVDQDDEKDMKEVVMKQEKVDVASETKKPVDQDDAKDMKELTMEQKSIDDVIASETNKPVDQDDAKDTKEVAMEQEQVEDVIGSETTEIEDSKEETQQEEISKNELQENSKNDVKESSLPTDSDQLDTLNSHVEQSVQSTSEQISTVELIQSNIQESNDEDLVKDQGKHLKNDSLEKEQSIQDSDQTDSQNEDVIQIEEVVDKVDDSQNDVIQIDEVVDKVDDSDVKIDNANIIDEVKDNSEMLQHPTEESVCEDQNMEVDTQPQAVQLEPDKNDESEQDIGSAKTSNENISEAEDIVEQVTSQSPAAEHLISGPSCSDEAESMELCPKQNEEFQDQNLLQIHQYDESTDPDKSIEKEITQSIEIPSVLADSNESELQNAISHIIDTATTIDDSNEPILQSTVITSNEADQSNLLDLQNDNSPIFDSTESADIKTSEIQSAISQIIEVSEIVDGLDSTSELQSAISHIIGDSEAVADSDKTNEAENAIAQIIDPPELEKCTDDGIVHSDILQNQIDNINSSTPEVGVEDGSERLEKIDAAVQENEEPKPEISQDTETIEETRSEDNEGKADPESIIQSIYTQPVVDLILENMDDQLKIFDSKSHDAIANISNIREVDVDTPKIFESQHIDLILPEETSLLNTDDIISEIAPENQEIVEFPHQVDIKLQEQHVSENELKIDDLHVNESKDLNDVIAREIESLLELQTQNLTDDASTIDNETGEDLAIKMETQMGDFVLEAKMPNTSENSENTNVEDNKIIEDAVLQENIFHSTTREADKSEKDSDCVEEEANKKEPNLNILVQKPDIGEVSSSSVVNVEVSYNQESDSLITSTESSELQPAKELDIPLVIEVGMSVTTIEEKVSISQTQTIDVPTSEYSSKMSDNQDLKMTITKHKIESTTKVSESSEVDDSHSILKIYDPKDNAECRKTQKPKETVVPKLIIKPIVRSQSSPTPIAKHLEEVEPTVPKLFLKNMSPNRPCSPKIVKSQKSEITSPLKLTIKPVLKSEEIQSKSSPKLTIKPIVKTDEDTSTSGPKITIKPIVKPPEEELCHSPKITIKPIIKPDDSQAELVHSPRITIKPIPKPDEVKEFCPVDIQNPRITIKPVIKPEESGSPEKEVLKKSSDVESSDRSHSPKVTIKPVKPEEHKASSKQDLKLKQDDLDKKEGSPKITIKPIVKPVDSEPESVELIDFEDQIKQERIVLKINKNSMSKDSRKRDSTEEIEKLAKIKLKLSKEGGRAQIVSEQSKLKRALEESLEFDQKRTKFESDLTITPIDADAKKTEKVVEIIKDDVNITPIETNTRPIFDDPLEKIPVFEITPESAVMMKSTTATIVQQVTAPAPRKRGRPRKVPLVVREEFKDTKEEEIQQQEQQQPVPEDTGRPKRSCRGPSVRTTLGIRTRKPRGSGRGRGRGRGARGVGSRGGRQQRVSAAKLKLLKEEAAAAIAEQSKCLEPEDGGDVEMKEEPAVENVTTETSEIVLIEEETRMSADINTSRAQTPAKQIPTPGDVDDTQSSVQSTATTESTKARRGTRVEIYPEPEGEIISADQLTEYYWGGGGPFMLQEQVAQFLGIKSFKRKYPGIQRRTVDMQERDFIRESGLASEAMCDLGLTAVHSADILDILYSDFQNKYEEYCKHQRDRQAKDFSNKQKALSLAASQEKNKQDIMQQAVQSAASWNANFNKSRREERKACMDLQTFTVHYPKGRFKMVEKNKVGHYPVSLVPGQYTDYYKGFSSNELCNLPLNTMLDKPLNIPVEDDSQSDGSGSDSDSSSSDSDSSSSDSTDEDCNICSPTSSNQSKKVLAN